MSKKKVTLIVVLAVVLTICATLVLAKTTGFFDKFIANKQEEIHEPTTHPFSVAAYQEKLKNMRDTSFRDAKTAISDLTEFEGILPDEAVKVYLDFLGENMGDWFNKEMGPNYNIENSSYEIEQDYYDKAKASEFNEKYYVYIRYEGEGYFGFTRNYKTIHNALKDKLSDAFDSYLELCSKYYLECAQYDAALVITWDELAEELVAWSIFKKDYPNFIDIERVDWALSYGMFVYCFGMDNTPTLDGYWSDNRETILYDEIRVSYEKFLNNPENKVCIYYEDINKLYNAWKDANFKADKKVEDILEKINKEYCPW